MANLRQIMQSDMALPFSDLGVEITYTPDSSLGIGAFTVTGIPGSVDLNNSMGQGKGAASTVLVRHSELAAAGMIEPVPRGGGKNGDTAAMENLAGETETFTVVDADPSEAGCWQLTLQKLGRVDPQ